MHIGLADFAEPTLLIIGEATTLNLLADYIQMRQSVDMETLPFVRMVGIRLVIAQSHRESNLRRADSLFTWEIASLDSSGIVEQLRELAASAIPAHAYLDVVVNAAGVQIVASNGEYEADVLLNA